MNELADLSCQKKYQLSTAVNQLSKLTFKTCKIRLFDPKQSFTKRFILTYFQHQPSIG